MPRVPRDGDPHQLAHACGVDVLERVRLEQALLQIGRHHPALDVVAAETECHLGEVIRPEREEVGHLGDLAGEQRGPGRLDHRADGDFDALAGLAAFALVLRGRHALERVEDPGPGQSELLRETVSGIMISTSG